MAFRIHALRVCDVIATLHFVGRTLPGARAHGASREEPDTCAHARVTTGAAEGGSGERADRSADHGAAHRGVFSRLSSGRATDLGVRILPAVAIVVAKLIKALAGAGQHHDARTGRHGDAAGEPQHCQQQTRFQKIMHERLPITKVGAAERPAARVRRIP